MRRVRPAEAVAAALDGDSRALNVGGDGIVLLRRSLLGSSRLHGHLLLRRRSSLLRRGRGRGGLRLCVGRAGPGDPEANHSNKRRKRGRRGS